MEIKNPEFLKKLEKSGLNEKEALVYLTLLELGGAFPSKIAEYTGLNRSTVYMVLLNLSVRGLISEIEKRNKQFYQIENPNRLVRYTESKMDLIENEIEQAKRILPELDGLFTSMGYKPKVTYFEGLDQVIEAYNSHINVNKPYEMLAWANTDALEEFFPKKYFDEYRRTKEKKNITTRAIIAETDKAKSFNERLYPGYVAKIVPNFRFIPKENFPFNAEITLFDRNKISIINFVKGKLIAVIIEDETIHGLMKMIFELSWVGAQNR